MFAGQYPCKLDEKGRFLVPSPIREQLEAAGNSVVLVKGHDLPLCAYSFAEWQKMLERARESFDEDQSRLFMHYVVAEAATSEMDKTGRILIPGRLRKAVPIEDDLEVVLIGMYRRLEIWNPSDWRRYVTRNSDKFEQCAAKFFDFH